MSIAPDRRRRFAHQRRGNCRKLDQVAEFETWILVHDKVRCLTATSTQYGEDEPWPKTFLGLNMLFWVSKVAALNAPGTRPSNCRLHCCALTAAMTERTKLVKVWGLLERKCILSENRRERKETEAEMG